MPESEKYRPDYNDPLFDLILKLYKDQSIELSCPICQSKEIISNHLYHPLCQNCGLEFNVNYTRQGKLAVTQLLLQDQEIRNKGEGAHRFFRRAAMNFQELLQDKTKNASALTGALIAQIASFDTAGIKKIFKEQREQIDQSLKQAGEAVKEEFSLLNLLILISLLERKAWLTLIQGKTDKAKELYQIALTLLEGILKQSDLEPLSLLQSKKAQIEQRVQMMDDQNSSLEKTVSETEKYLQKRLKQAVEKIKQGKKDHFQAVHRPDFVKVRETVVKLLETAPLSPCQQEYKLALIESFLNEGQMILEKGNSAAAIKRFQEGEDALQAFEWALDHKQVLDVKEKLYLAEEKAQTAAKQRSKL